MRKIWLIIIIIMFTTIRAEAIAPVNDNTINAALDYGKSKAAVPLREFFLPWTVYEEDAVRLGETAERACLFTPFLLIAADARDRTASGAPVTSGDVERVLGDYNGYVIFAVTLYGKDAKFSGKVTASLRQEGAVSRARLVNVPQPAAAVVSANGEPLYEAQCFVYFPAKEVMLDRAAKLVINAGDRRHRRFHFPLERYK